MKKCFLLCLEKIKIKIKNIAGIGIKHALKKKLKKLKKNKKKREKKLSVTIYNVFLFFPITPTALQASWPCREGADVSQGSKSFSLALQEQ